MPHVDPEVVLPSATVPVPWANGLGITRVLVDGVGWRLSVAEIEGEQEFSPLPGRDRILIPILGERLALEVEGIRHEVPLRTALAFRGEDRVVAEAVGRVSVVNLMTVRDAVAVDARIGSAVADAHAVVVLGGGVRFEGRDLEPGALVRAGGLARVDAGEDAVLLSIRLRGATG